MSEMKKTNNLHYYGMCFLLVSFVLLFAIQTYRYYTYKVEIRSELSRIFATTNDLKIEKAFLQEQLRLNYGVFKNISKDSVSVLSKQLTSILEKNEQSKPKLVIVRREGGCNNCFSSLLSAVADSKNQLLSGYSIHVMVGEEQLFSPAVSFIKKTSRNINIYENVNLDVLGAEVNGSYVYILETDNTIGKIFVPNILYPDYQRIFLQGL